MNKPNRFVASPVSLLLLLGVLSGPAQAGLPSVGPVNPAYTIPNYYMDPADLALMPCTDQNGFCILPPPFDAVPVTSTITTLGPIDDTNFPDEGFYYSAEAIMPIEASNEQAKLTFVLEFAFLAGVTPNGGVVFLRTDLQKMSNLVPNATYRVTHPYGQFEFTTDAAGDTTAGGGVATRIEDMPGVPADWLPTGMQSAPNTGIGPFLVRADGIFPTAIGNDGLLHTYIGNPTELVTVTGSPTNNNFFRIDRISPSGGTTRWETNLFTLMGRVYTDQIPSPLTINRTVYARDAVTGQVNVFAGALASAQLTISGNGLPAMALTKDVPSTGKFFAHIPVTTLPTDVSITNSLDNPVINYPVTLVDEVNITQATYDPTANSLTIMAASRDKLSPPTLTVPQFAGPNTLDGTGTLVKTLPVGAIAPLTVQVNSSNGGQATALVSVVTAPLAPVAVADSATTAANEAVIINVLANDTTTGTLDPTSVVTAAPIGGTAVANANGTVTFTPTNGFSGAASFTYMVKDVLAQVSNAATVSVTLTAAVVNPATGVTITPNLASPQPVGTAVAFTAAGIGGTASAYQYQFWLFDGTAWSMKQDFGVGSIWAASLPVGNYFAHVRLRTSDAVPYDSTSTTASVAFEITSAPASGVTLTPSLSSPQLAGTPVTFTASGIGGVPALYSYQFWLLTGGTWSMVQDFGVGDSWTPSLPAASYIVHVRLRTSPAVPYDSVGTTLSVPYTFN